MPCRSTGSNNLRNILQRLNMYNLVFEKTNFTTDTGTCIDLFLTNNKSCVKSVDILSPFCSTHAPVCAEVNFKVNKEYTYKRTIRKYENANYKDFVSDLNHIDWNEHFHSCDNINDMYSQFLNIYSTNVNKYIPTKVVTIRPADKPFMNSTIQSKEQYKQKLTKEITDKNIPPGKWWRIVKSISKLSKSREPTPFLKSEGQIFLHPVNKAELLNSHFSNISKIDIEPELPNNVPDPPFKMEEIIITEEEVLDQLKNLNCNKPSGPDGVSPRILKEIKSGIVKPLTLITLLDKLSAYGVDIDLNLILFGDQSMSIEDNVQIVKAVHEYIKNSERFV
ncbi:unnamed protein product [Mytilus edulis]|uniref:Uncharacterized protein n=1 Tax=Mytilus edulis TaxID=6550 RepID=A0A8S3PNR5_MYTED|nr:unnamed protein product [Mytilus edulis]